MHRCFVSRMLVVYRGSTGRSGATPCVSCTVVKSAYKSVLIETLRYPFLFSFVVTNVSNASLTSTFFQLMCTSDQNIFAGVFIPDILEYIATFCDIDSRRALGFSPRLMPNIALPHIPLPICKPHYGYSYIELRLPRYDPRAGIPDFEWNSTCIILLYDHWSNQRKMRIPTYDDQGCYWDGNFAW